MHYQVAEGGRHSGLARSTRRQRKAKVKGVAAVIRRAKERCEKRKRR